MPVNKIDVHAHVVPPFWGEAVRRSGRKPIPPDWNAETHLSLMDQCGITKSFLSITTPGSHLIPGEDQDARRLAHDCNVFLAELKNQYPTRFAFFATLPLPDVDGSLVEIGHAFDQLHADGVALLTNHHGLYLGNPVFQPVFDALNKRKAKVFIHPTVPCQILPGGRVEICTPQPNFSQGILEYSFEEARALFDLLASGVIAHYQDITPIIPHAGGAFPPILERFVRFSSDILEQDTNDNINGSQVRETIQQRFFFDLAGFVLPDQLHALLQITDHTRLLYGSDYPYTPARSTKKLSTELEEDRSIPMSESMREDIFSRNAVNLFGLYI